MNSFNFPEVNFIRIRSDVNNVSSEDIESLLQYAVASEARKTASDAVTNYQQPLQSSLRRLSDLGIQLQTVDYRPMYVHLNRRSDGVYSAESINTNASSAMRNLLLAQPTTFEGHSGGESVSERLRPPKAFSRLRKSNVKHPDSFVIHCVDLPVEKLEEIALEAGVNSDMIDICEKMWVQLGALMYTYKCLYLPMQNLDEERHVHHLVLRCVQEMLCIMQPTSQPTSQPASQPNRVEISASLYPLKYTLSVKLNCIDGLTPFSGVPNLLVETARNSLVTEAITNAHTSLVASVEKVRQSNAKLQSCRDALESARSEVDIDVELRAAATEMHEANVRYWEALSNQCLQLQSGCEDNYRRLVHSSFRTFLELKFPAFRHGTTLAPSNGLGAGAKSQTCGQCVAQQSFIGGGAVSAILSDGVSSAALLLLPHRENKHTFIYLRRCISPRVSMLNTILPMMLSPQALLESVRVQIAVGAAGGKGETGKAETGVHTNCSKGDNNESGGAPSTGDTAADDTNHDAQAPGTHKRKNPDSPEMDCWYQSLYYNNSIQHTVVNGSGCTTTYNYTSDNDSDSDDGTGGWEHEYGAEDSDWGSATSGHEVLLV